VTGELFWCCLSVASLCRCTTSIETGIGGLSFRMKIGEVKGRDAE
jgi:hypothetical protein